MRSHLLVFGIPVDLFLVVVLGAFCAFPAFAQWNECEDDVFAVVTEGTVTVHHQGAHYNCCPEFAYSVEVAGSQVTVVETEVLAQCWCTCCFDLEVDVEGLAPGTYTLVFRWYDYDAADWVEVTLTVVVPDLGQVVDPVLGPFSVSDCLPGPTAVPEPAPGESGLRTWGTIKSLYR